MTHQIYFLAPSARPCNRDAWTQSASARTQACRSGDLTMEPRAVISF